MDTLGFKVCGKQASLIWKIKITHFEIKPAPSLNNFSFYWSKSPFLKHSVLQIESSNLNLSLPNISPARKENWALKFDMMSAPHIPTYNLYENHKMFSTKDIKEKIWKLMLNKHGKVFIKKGPRRSPEVRETSKFEITTQNLWRAY